MQDLSARAKFPDARFQLPLLIMLKIVAEIQFAYQIMETFFFSIQTTIGSFGGNTSGIKTRLATTFVIQT